MTDREPVTDTLAFVNTGKSLKDWRAILDAAKASGKKPDEFAAFLEKHHGVQRKWAETLAGWYGGSS